MLRPRLFSYSLFLFNDAAPPELYTLSLHDALPISSAAFPSPGRGEGDGRGDRGEVSGRGEPPTVTPDRKSTRLNSSHPSISYAVFCLKKKKQTLHSDTIPQHISPDMPGCVSLFTTH